MKPGECGGFVVLAAGSQAMVEAVNRLRLAEAYLSPSSRRRSWWARAPREAVRTENAQPYQVALSRLFLILRYVIDRVLPEARVMGAAQA